MSAGEIIMWIFCFVPSTAFISAARDKVKVTRDFLHFLLLLPPSVRVYFVPWQCLLSLDKELQDEKAMLRLTNSITYGFCSRCPGITNDTFWERQNKKVAFAGTSVLVLRKSTTLSVSHSSLILLPLWSPFVNTESSIRT